MINGPSPRVVRAASGKARSEEPAEPAFAGEQAPEDRNAARADAAARGRREFINGLLLLVSWKRDPFQKSRGSAFR
ncbi:MAG TPA: hypothetical protein PK141_23665, partial [Polyangiaceae bacterium]|nr:hypothetical protein [Polyangiaceae bacterium]